MNQNIGQVRTNDPATSHTAARKVKKMTIKESILDLLECYPAGLTGEEIAECTGHRLNSITPRFAELSRYTGKGYGLTTPKIVNSTKVRNGQIVWSLW